MTSSRQVVTSFDRAFQNLFSVITDILALYRQHESVDGSSGLDGVSVSANTVEENMKVYKTCFDTTGTEIHVDMVLELYSKVRASLHRGYQCDSWLRNDNAVFYYGVSAAEAGQSIVQLSPVFLMLESLKRSDSATRSQSSILKIRFSNQLYTVFMTAMRYSQTVGQETKIGSLDLQDELTVMEGLQTEILNDLPKPEKAAAGPAAPSGNPLAGLASLFPGGLSDVMGSLLQTLPNITRTVTETVARTTGNSISDTDQQMIDSVLTNITDGLRNPDGMRSMLADMSSGPDGITRFVQRILTPGSAASAEPASTAALLPSPGGEPPALD